MFEYFLGELAPDRFQRGLMHLFADLPQAAAALPVSARTQVALEICEEVAPREPFNLTGLSGSATARARFNQVGPPTGGDS